MKISDLADQVRGISLRHVLERYGFYVKREGTTLRAKGPHHNIVVTGSRWFDNKAGLGGGGAIDLVIHLAKANFSTACRSLADDFLSLAAGQSALSFPKSWEEPLHTEKKFFEGLAAIYAIRDDSNWPVARAYLVPPLVDELHARDRSTPTIIDPIRVLFSCIVTNRARYGEPPFGTPNISQDFALALGISSLLGLRSEISARPAV
jgi:hypothetical protein